MAIQREVDRPTPSVAVLVDEWRGMGQAWALPLNLALAIASGLPASAGLVAGAIGGVVAAIFGGAALQVTGPAAALQVLVLSISTQFGATGVAAATLMIGVLQLLLGLSRAGRLARFVPESVLAGFTTGVGLKLLDAQIPELLGFDYRVSELAAMMHRPEWLKEVEWLAAVSGLAVALFVVGMRQFKRFPAAIVGVTTVTFVSIYLKWDVTRVGEVPHTLPPLSVPVLKDDQWLDLFLATLPLALLAAVESLLSASAIDRMAPDRPKHHPSLELFGQGLANLAVGLFQGMPVTGVVVRSGVNVQAGGRTRLAAALHGLALGGAVLLLSTQLAQVPLAALAGLLCVIGVRLIEVATLLHLVKEDKLEAVAFLLAAAGTVSGHLMAGLGAGLAVHAVARYLRRDADVEQALIADELKPGIRAVVPADGARRPHGDAPASAAAWLSHVRHRPLIPATAFVHPQASVIGQVVLGDNVHIAAGSSVRADEGTPFFIGDNSNVQDGVVLHALKEKHVQVGQEKWAIYVGRNVSMAHDALVHGPCYVGDDTFIGFKAVVHDAVVGRGCFIGIGAVVVGVTVPDGRFVPHGHIVDTADKVDGLPLVSEAQHHFNEDVVDVNRGLAAAYRAAVASGRRLPVASSEPGRRPWDEAWAPATGDRF
ncbi:MAG: SulP family inorganic anion transporter [Myxococcaceae bacterium]|nr:SulP family inorganic anion transporter [Myxococcaceae bacterium]